jgi:serine/threonine-protein kinase
VTGPAAGTRLRGGYVLEASAASGAMGSVYRGRAADGRPVAAKRLLDPRGAARFEIEARVLRRLDHPRVVRVLDTVEDPTGLYLIMEWIEGTDLAALLRRDGSPGLPAAAVVDAGLQAAEALRYVHEQHTVHRDVKPRNLMHSPEGGVVLVDFGIAVDPVEQGTREVGTPGFMAPEAYAGGPFTARTDVYGLAATLWTLLTGRPPRIGEREHLRGIAPHVAATLARGLEIDPRNRLPGMEAFADGLGGRLPAEGAAIGRALAPDGAVAALLHGIVKTAAGVFDAAATSLALAAADGELTYQAAWGAGADEVLGMRLAAGEGVAGRVAASGAGEVVPECRADSDFAFAVAERTGYVPHTMIVAPLVRATGPVGVLTVLDRRDGEPYGVADLDRATLFAELALSALATEPGLLADVEQTKGW